MRRRYLTLDDFRECARDAEELEDDAVVCLNVPTDVRIVPDVERTLEFTISTASVDRFGDTIDVGGWDFKNYLKNPVILWAHDQDSLPVAKASRLSVESKALKATAQFTRKGLAKFNDIIYEMLTDGFLNAVSVGFMPKKWAFADAEERKTGIDFIEQELLEFSVVPVPANPQALIDGRSFGEKNDFIQDWAKKVLGVTEDHLIIKSSVMQEYENLRTELNVRRAEELMAPKATPMPRLTAAFADLARLKSA